MTASPPVVESVRPLGAGATSSVELVRLVEPFAELPAGALVAAKRLAPSLVRDPRALAALAAEAEAGARVRHRSLVPVLWHGVLSGREEEGPALLLGHVPGRALADVVREEGPLPEPVVRAIGADLAGALAALHAAEIVHGDLKPENARLDAEGRAVLLDLGLARRATEDECGAPRADAGSVAWLSPERARGEPARPPSDVFALGVVLHELATGAHPYLGASSAGSPPSADAALAAIAAARSRPPSRLAPRLSPFFDALVLDCLRRAPARRPSAAEVERRLREGEAGDWWRARVAAARAARSPVLRPEAHLTPFVGRERELALLEEALAGVARSGRGAAVWLAGPAGSGKWRLVNELAARARLADRPPLHLYARWTEEAESRPAGALAMLLHRWLELPTDSPPTERERRRLAAVVSPDDARVLADALDPRTRERGGAAVAPALASWLAALARSAPVLVHLDDLHLAGEVTLDALASVAAGALGGAVLLVLGARDDEPPASPAALSRLRERLAAQGALRDIALAPLDPPAVRALVDALFHRAAPRLRIAEALWSRSHGNPGLLAEILRDLLASGRAHAADESGRLALEVAPEELPQPASLERIVAERIASLAPDERRWLERLAVLGGRVDAELVARALPGASRAEADAALAALARGGWLAPVGARYRFARPALREAVYGSIPEGRRARLHAAAARGLAPLRGRSQPAEEAWQRAVHLRAAARWRELLDAVVRLSRALRLRASAERMRILARFGLEALDRLGRPAELRATEIELLEAAADAADRLGQRGEGRALLDRLVEREIDPGQSPGAAARLYLLHGRLAAGTGRYGLARGMFRNAAELSERAGDDVLVSQSLRRLALVQAHVGELEDARALAERALERAATANQVGLAHLALALVDVLAGHVEDALREVDACLGVVREAPAPYQGVVAHAHLLRARVYRAAGRPTRAHGAARRAARLARSAGERRTEAEARARLGWTLVDLGRPEDAEAELREALTLAVEIEDRRGEVVATLGLGTLLWEAERPGAVRSFERAAELAEEIGFYRGAALALAFQARHARATGELERAGEASARAALLVERHGAELVDRVAVTGTRALVLHELGRETEARALVRALRRRMRRESARIANPSLRRSQRVYTTRLLEAVLSPEGPVYPRFAVADPS